VSDERGLKRTAAGSGHRYTLDGKPVPGVTTVLYSGYPKPALINWAARVVAEHAVDYWDELADLPKNERRDQLRGVHNAERNRAGDVGTRVHAFVLRQALGFKEAPDADIDPHLDSYEAFVRDWQPHELVAEAVVGNRAFGYAGTLDTIAKLIDGRNWLLDFKTGRSGVWPDHCVQLSAYARAEFYVDRSGVEQPLPPIDRVGIVLLHHDDYSLVPVDAGEDTFGVFLSAFDLYRYGKRDKGELIGERLTPPAREVVA
jgi:hypothetical protein